MEPQDAEEENDLQYKRKCSIEIDEQKTSIENNAIINTPKSAKKTNSVNSVNSLNSVNNKVVPNTSSSNLINNSLGMNSTSNINFYNFPNANINNS